jgi:hypothetical protein
MGGLAANGTRAAKKPHGIARLTASLHMAAKTFG